VDEEGPGGKEKRRVVTLADVRKGWQAELERRSVVEGGRWGFGFDGVGEEGEMDVN